MASTSSMQPKNGTSLILSTIRWCSRILWWLRPRPQLGHLAIPPEIISMIAAYLSKPSLLSLALTCRTFYHYFFPQSLGLSPSEKEEFLLLLEKDAAPLYFCHFCVKLHQWRASWFRGVTSLFPDFYCQDKDCCRTKYPVFDGLTFNLPYPLARVVMNRHFYGAAHGVPARKLAVSAGMTFSDMKLDRVWDARIIDDQLMLSSVLTMVPRGDAKMLRQHIDGSGQQICPHIRIGDCAGHPRPPELTRNSSPPDYFASCHQSVKSCTLCMTDYCIDITRKAKGWVIRIVIYHQLGTVRSPFDWNWSSMTRSIYSVPSWSGGETAPRLMHPSGHQPGIVRHTWSKADKVVLEPEGEWIGSPRLAYGLLWPS